MKIKIEINNRTSCNFNKKKLELVIQKTILQTRLAKMPFKSVEISIGLISAKQIQKINQKYRNKNYPTDILSFTNYENMNDIVKSYNDEIFLGELLICCKDIKEYTENNNIPFNQELYKVTSHGILHLLGFSHSDEMFKIQDKIVAEIV